MIKISPYIPSYTTSYLWSVAYYDDRGKSLLETRSYNLRSWLTGIDNTLFKEELSYQDGAVPQWGGNISEMSWGPGNATKKYRFVYDSLSRLVTATYSDEGTQAICLSCSLLCQSS